MAAGVIDKLWSVDDSYSVVTSHAAEAAAKAKRDRRIQRLLERLRRGEYVNSAMADKTDRKRWKPHDKWVAVAVALFAAYIGAYYASFGTEFRDGRTTRRVYEIFGAEFPACSEAFFAPADWIEQRLQLGPHKPIERIP